MIPKSLRWRLPLSYAAVALLAILALGAALLLLLQEYYRQQELAYLDGNAQSISEHLVPYFADLDVGELQATIKGLAFLSQTRVRVLSPDSGLLLADSGDPRINDANTEIAMTVNIDGVEQTFAGAAPFSSSESTIVIESPFLGSQIEEEVLAAPPGSAQVEEREFVLEEETVGPDGTITRTTTITRETVSGALPVVGTQFGFGFVNADGTVATLSNLIVKQPIRAEDGALLGLVELSQGPAYGREILQTVFWSWLLALVLAALLAGTAGWLASRQLVQPLLKLTAATTRMAEGDLAVRTELQSANELGQLGHSFNQMAEQVEQTIMTLRQFIADAAHELHTPLTALQTDLQSLDQTRLAPAQAAKIERAQGQAVRLQTLSNSLLDLSRIEARTEKEKELVDLDQMLRELAEPFASRAEQREVQFALALPGHKVPVWGSPLRLRQAVQNVLDNALKFTPAGGVIHLSLAKAATQAQLTVTDTGIGIPEEDMPYLFSRFHRGRNSADYPGNGLGLAIVQAIIQSHGGQISLHRLSPGTQVDIQLPLS
ncbi:MAG: HAMP domain-containing histidine kinase [Anaerolineales bacterium]|nr:HAMP domain-containing histidine kinase [Anaerolineales bacterium]